MAERHRLCVDARWTGNHGIGRYSHEVLSRLTLPFDPISNSIGPLTSADIVNPSRIKLKKSDQIYSPGFNAGLSRAKQFITLHDLIHLEDEEQKSFAKSLYYQSIVKPVIKRAGLVFTVSGTSAMVIEKWLGDSSLEIVVTGCGVSDSFTLKGSAARFDKPTFIYVGNTKPHKNLSSLLRGFALRPDFDLILVTSNPEETHKLTSQMGVEKTTSVMSKLTDEEIAHLIRGSSGLVFPSVFEGFGLPAVEAMACGKQVAYWEGCSSISEICGGSGVPVCDARDAQEWANALDALVLVNSEPYQPKDEWTNKYSWDKVASVVNKTLKAQISYN